MKFLSQMCQKSSQMATQTNAKDTEDTNSTLSTQCLMILMISRRIHLFLRVSCCIFARSGVAVHLPLKGKATKFKVPMLCLGKMH